MIGERMKEVREKNGLTQSALAKKLNISRSAVNAWEMGVSIPSAQYLVELSKLFKVTTDYLLGLSTEELVDISFLEEEEKKLLYGFLDYFKKYGDMVRSIHRQIEAPYDEIREMPEAKAKDILEQIKLMSESS